MDVQEELLQRFAKMIDLPAFLSQRGYALVEPATEARFVMKDRASGDTLELEKDVERGGWTYVNARAPAERGDVADLIARRDGIDRKQCLERLIPCCDERGRGTEEAARYRAVLRAMPPELASAIRGHEAAKRVELAATVALERAGVPRGTLDESRFGAAKRDADVATLVAEPKALWVSKYRPGDKAIVLVERPIDAIAYERVHGKQQVCYVATGSDPGPDDRRKLAHLLAEIPTGTRLVLGYGRDEAGRRLATEVQALAPSVSMERRAPELGARWADQLQLERRHALSMKRLGATLQR